MRSDLARPLLFALAATVVEVATVAAILALADGAYDARRPLDESHAVAASYVALGLGSLAALVLALSGAWTAVLRSRPWHAGALVTLVFGPLVLVATVALYGVLVLLGLI